MYIKKENRKFHSTKISYMIKSYQLPKDVRYGNERMETVDKNVSVITDLDGSKIALINDVRFQSRRGIDWNAVE